MHLQPGGGPADDRLVVISRRALRGLRIVGLVLAVGLVPLGVGIVFVQRGADQSARQSTARALGDEARIQAASLTSAFASSRSLILLAARDTALRDLLEVPGGRAAQLRRVGEVRAVNAELGYLQRLYPAAIGGASLIDGQGRELASVVRGKPARTGSLSLAVAGAPFFGRTLALPSGQVFQAAPYESPDTGEWVISNSARVPNLASGRRALLHFEVTIESLRRQAASSSKRFAVAVVDARDGRIAFDTRSPQRRGAPLGSQLNERYPSLAAFTGGARTVELGAVPAAVRPVAAQPGNVNRWLVVVTPVVSPGRPLADAVVPLVGLTVALLIGVGVAMALRYQSVSDAALTDPVTELPNRRAFIEQVGRRLATVTPARPFSLLVLDLDDLQQVNEADGHVAGDRLLRAAAACLRQDLPDDSCAFRLAGGQLAVSTSTHAWGAFRLASELQHRLADDLRIATRIGVSEHQRGGDVEELLRAADIAAAAARRSGLGVLVHSGTLDASAESQPEAHHQHALAIALARAVDAKDAYTHSHCETVAELSALIATELGLDDERVTRIRLAGLVHDVGKIGVPDAILNKPGPLDCEEFATVKGHAAAGHRILAGTELAVEAQWVRHHHERVDGRGYPDGLSGDRLSLEARILHVADACEAMTSDRPYRRGMPQSAAIQELIDHVDAQFDRECVVALIRRLDPVTAAVDRPRTREAVAG